jgi:hypothetical protein
VHGGGSGSEGEGTMAVDEAGMDARTLGLPPQVGGWIVRELLEAVNRCLFCGNSFVTLL